MTSRSRLLVGYGSWLIAFAALGLPKAMERHFHVDEFQVAYNAALWGVHNLPELSNYAAPYLVPLSHLVGALQTSSEMMLVLRLIFLGVFAAILVACALAQPYFRLPGQRLGVLCALTIFHPLWLNAHEIRHDAIVVLGAVILYGFAQRVVEGANAAWLFLAAGIVSGTMQMNSFKAIVYWPVFGGVLVLLGTRAAWATGGWARARPAMLFVAGVISGVAANAALLLADGKMAAYVASLAPIVNSAGTTERFTPTNELIRLAIVSPVVFGFALCGCALFARDVARRHVTARSALTMGWLSWTIVTLYVNPRPFPYNHMYVLPFVALAALDAAARVSATGRRVVVLATAVLASAVVFGLAWMTDPYLRRTNRGQLSYMAAAEALTGPNDTVLDGVGLVLTRRPPHKHWMIHSLWRADYRSGRRTSFADIMRANPSPVMIDNYRWAWLSPSDRQLRDARYLRVAPHLLVLGEQLSPGAGQLVVSYPGRYRVSGIASVDVRVQVDGKPLPDDGVVQLSMGNHRYDLPGADAAILRWLGPNLSANDTVKIVSLGSGEWLFMNEPMPLVL